MRNPMLFCTDKKNFFPFFNATFIFQVTPHPDVAGENNMINVVLSTTRQNYVNLRRTIKYQLDNHPENFDTCLKGFCSSEHESLDALVENTFDPTRQVDENGLMFLAIAIRKHITVIFPDGHWCTRLDKREFDSNLFLYFCDKKLCRALNIPPSKQKKTGDYSEHYSELKKRRDEFR